MSHPHGWLSMPPEGTESWRECLNSIMFFLCLTAPLQSNIICEFIGTWQLQSQHGANASKTNPSFLFATNGIMFQMIDGSQNGNVIDAQQL